tara:strand:+ start:1163 stop:1729 length:567 start_codon:yes stop_codon:yes gene_type:complete
LKIGILALQGDFHEHQNCFIKLGIKTKLVKSTTDLDKCDSIVIPGGESTTISKLLFSTNIDKAIIKKASNGFPVWGTCAGLILISDKLVEKEPTTLKLINITTSRNFYGRQIDSFVEKINFQNKEFEAIFIRAPKIIKTEKNIKVLSATSDGTPVAVQSKNILGTSFHPELTDDLKVHELFANMTINK